MRHADLEIGSFTNNRGFETWCFLSPNVMRPNAFFSLFFFLFFLSFFFTLVSSISCFFFFSSHGDGCNTVRPDASFSFSFFQSNTFGWRLLVGLDFWFIHIFWWRLWLYWGLLVVVDEGFAVSGGGAGFQCS